ncbi:hypothetical protein PENTCL1PPCAC_8124 [Pristionchus entomophagus]|uniref:Uncharacterized protein n=1 Tax=Pristionchus entomophagus TaxID=358040 RepID=A0AAV5SX60_9BILA|nr:hypothetical protein PENTCL1PPCAC_8124 [Pristionchus entomophagus]
MLSRKLNKLRIINDNYPEYLSLNDANKLRERLPLINKKIWFEVTCNQYDDGLNYEHNDHSVQADRRHTNGYNDSFRNLRIKHVSRAD